MVILKNIFVNLGGWVGLTSNVKSGVQSQLRTTVLENLGLAVIFRPSPQVDTKSVLLILLLMSPLWMQVLFGLWNLSGPLAAPCVHLSTKRPLIDSKCLIRVINALEFTSNYIQLHTMQMTCSDYIWTLHFQLYQLKPR